MLSKLLKNDLKKNMRILSILFISTLIIAGMTRCLNELGKSFIFFEIASIFFESVYYTLAVNIIIHPFLRNFLNFTKSFYSDESYLTHTLPVTKNQLINSKYLTAIIEISLGFICLIASILIMYANPTMDQFLTLFLSTVISGEFSLYLVLSLFVILVIVEFLMFISIIYFSIVIAYKSKEKRVFKSFLITALTSFISLSILAVVMIAVLLINGINLTSTTLTLSYPAFISIILTGIIVYLLISILFYFLAKKEFNKGVNVD